MKTDLAAAFNALTEQEEKIIGQKLVTLLSLKPATNYDKEKYPEPRYQTEFGTKTALGLFRTIAGVMISPD